MRSLKERRERQSSGKDSGSSMISLKYLKLWRMRRCHCKITSMLRWLRSAICSRNQKSCHYPWTRYLGSYITSRSNTRNLDLKYLLSLLQMKMWTNFTWINLNLTR